MTRWTHILKKELLTVIDWMDLKGHMAAKEAILERLELSDAELSQWRNGSLRANPRRSQAFKRAA